MSEPIILKGKAPDELAVDRRTVGISYSGGGPLVLAELGCARAFVQMGIIPAIITGVSAGALAGTAHALDVCTGAGIAMAARLLGEVSTRSLGLAMNSIPDFVRLAGRLLVQREHFVSLGDNAPIKPLVAHGLEQDFGLHHVQIGTFAPPHYPRLMIAATNRLNGTSEWFPPDTPLEDALVASSAIPAVFPWRDMTVDGDALVLVDGGVITNQPLSNLVLQGCGTIIACAVGYGGGTVAPPTNALNNALVSVSMMTHQCMKLEEDYVRLKLGGRGVVHHIHPEVTVPVQGYDFTPAVIEQVMNDACARTVTWLEQNRAAVGGDPAADPVTWLAETWPDDVAPPPP